MANTLQRLLYNTGALGILFFEFAIIGCIENEVSLSVIVSFFLGFLLSGYQLYFLKRCKKHVAQTSIRIETVESNDKLVIGYIVPYIVPMARFAIQGIDMSFYWLFIIALLIIFVMSFSNTVVPNPILLLLRYHTYTIKLKTGVSGYTLLSKRKIRNPKEVKYVCRVFDYLVMEMK